MEKNVNVSVRNECHTEFHEDGCEKPKKTYKASDFKLGESVKVLSMNLTGSVTSLPDAKGNVTVQMGILRSTVNIF